MRSPRTNGRICAFLTIPLAVPLLAVLSIGLASLYGQEAKAPKAQWAPDDGPAILRRYFEGEELYWQGRYEQARPVFMDVHKEVRSRCLYVGAFFEGEIGRAAALRIFEIDRYLARSPEQETTLGRKEERLDEVRRRKEAIRLYDLAREHYRKGMYVQARVLFVGLLNSPTDLDIFTLNDVRRYLKRIDMKMEGLLRKPVCRKSCTQ